MSITGKFIIKFRKHNTPPWLSPSICGPTYKAPLNKITWKRFIELVIEDLELRDKYKDCLEELKKINLNNLNHLKLNNGGLFGNDVRVDRIG